MQAGAPPELSRRSLLDVFLSGGIIAFLAAVFYPVARYLTPPKIDEVVTNSVVAAKVSEVTPNAGKIFRFGSKPGILIRLPSGEWRAFSAVCTHLQCTVQFRQDEEVIWCACHNGRYNLQGVNVSGPPPRPLTPLVVALKGDEVYASFAA